MRSHRNTGKQYPILSNKPVQINNPQRKAKMITAAWVVALVMCTVAGAYIAATAAIDQNDDSKRQLQAELDKRSKERDIQARQFQHAIEQYRIDVCMITGRLPQDPDVVDIRQRYRCTNPVVTLPAPTQSPAAVPNVDDSRTSVTALPRRPAPRPARPPADGLTPGPGVPVPGPAPSWWPPRPPTLPVPAPPTVPPLPPLPDQRCLGLLSIEVCLTLEL